MASLTKETPQSSKRSQRIIARKPRFKTATTSEAAFTGDQAAAEERRQNARKKARAFALTLLSFRTLVRQITAEKLKKPDLRFEVEAFAALQQMTSEFFVSRFSAANKVRIHARRSTLQVEDLKFVDTVVANLSGIFR
ncbi:hypothetical protein QBC34DRAFT_415106 [Podospora aff. communis PSN243]|uniref:Core Histone H2A/H2B/H3 domain-containing protein n=1 Tax=Podospora aff. communis PSN243 TaxID=3040156 RepID=A0AAV9GBI2_9PEZI|nr:hypothetical protein QBC34DRAFT_415106 [Podospora aff. communis PSN243]